jgi:hypothetical protein
MSWEIMNRLLERYPLPQPAHLLPRYVAKPWTEEPDAENSHVRIRGSCALKAHGIQSPEMVTPVKLSSQPGTESCVVIGNEHREA